MSIANLSRHGAEPARRLRRIWDSTGRMRGRIVRQSDRRLGVGILSRQRAIRMQWLPAILLTSIVALAAVIGVACAPVGMENGADSTSCVRGAEIAAPTVSYADDIVPLFSMSGCLSGGCHGGPFPSSGYSLETYDLAFMRGDEARAFDVCPIVPGDPESSYLIEKLSPAPRSGSRMPLVGPTLNDDEIELIETWIGEGAADN